MYCKHIMLFKIEFNLHYLCYFIIKYVITFLLSHNLNGYFFPIIIFLLLLLSTLLHMIRHDIFQCCGIAIHSSALCKIKRENKPATECPL